MQPYDVTVKHKPGKLHVPDTLSRLFAFEQEEMTKPKLTPICGNFPDDPALRTGIPYQPYQVSADELDGLKPVRSDRELFNTESVFRRDKLVRIG